MFDSEKEMFSDLLRKTKESRVIFVVSSSHKLGKARIDPDHPNPLQEEPSKKFHFIVYSMSKFACVLFATELARQLRGSGNMFYEMTCIDYVLIITGTVFTEETKKKYYSKRITGK